MLVRPSFELEHLALTNLKNRLSNCLRNTRKHGTSYDSDARTRLAYVPVFLVDLAQRLSAAGPGTYRSTSCRDTGIVPSMRRSGSALLAPANVRAPRPRSSVFGPPCNRREKESNRSSSPCEPHRARMSLRRDHRLP